MYVGSDDGHLYAVDIASQRELWRFAAGARIASSPAVSNGVVYVGSNDRHLYAIDAANGSLRWKYETGAEVFSSPAVSNGIVYVGSDDNHLYAFDTLSGELRWQYETEDWVSTDPAVGGGAVYVRSQDGILHAVDASTGEGLWQYNTSGQAISASPAFADGVVYTGGNAVYGVDASSGERVWYYRTDGRHVYSPTVADGVVYAGSEDGHLYALDASTQAPLWLYDGIQPTDAAPMVVDGAVYAQSEDGHLYAIDEFTGRLLWRSEMGGVSGAPRASGGVVYTGANGGKVYGMVASSPLATAAPAQEREAGDLLWRYRAGGFSISPPAVANGLLYFGDGAYLYAIDRTTGVLIWRYQFGRGVNSLVVTDDTVYVMGTGEGETHVYALHATNGELQWIYDRENARSLVVSRGVVYTRNGDGSVRALDASTGSLIWRYRPGGNPDGNWGSSPMVVVTHDTVYVGSRDTESGEVSVYALDVVTGSLRWRYSTGREGVGRPSIIVMNSVIYATFRTRYRTSVLALNALTGEKLWIDEYYRDADSPLTVVADGILYVAISRDSSRSYSITAIDASMRTRLWSTSSGTAPLIGDGVVYVGNAYAQNDVVGITHRGLDPATGETLWTSETERPRVPDESIDRTGQGTIDDGIVYSTVARSVHALHASTGEVLWTYNMGVHETLQNYRTTIDNGVLYAAGYNSIYAFVAPGLTWVDPTPTPTPTSTPNPLQRGRGAPPAGSQTGGTPVATATPVPTATPTATPTPQPFQRGRITFASNRDGNSDIYVINADGTGLRRLTDHPEWDQSPAWSPDGQRIAFESFRHDNWEIYVMNADGSNVTRLTNRPEGDFAPAWSLDGRRIAFESYRDGEGNKEIYVMNADGTGVTRLTNDPAWDGSPTWAPNGLRIAFESERDGNGDIYVMNSDGTGVIRVTNNRAWDEAPSWLPTAPRIVFHTQRDGNKEIYVINASGSGVTRLTDRLEADTNPAWSSDGWGIAFESETTNGDRDIYVMGRDGSNPVQLTDGEWNDESPSWWVGE